MRKKILGILLSASLVLGLTACGGQSRTPDANSDEQTASTAANTEGAAGDAATGDATAQKGRKILRTASSFAYPSLDVHKEYYGWYTSI